MNQPLAAHLEALERSLLEEAVRRDRTRLETLLAPDFREIGASGTVYDRDRILALLGTEPFGQVAITDISCMPIADGCALLTYTSRRVHDHPPQPVHRVSVWVLRDAGWQLLYHQGTPAR